MSIEKMLHKHTVLDLLYFDAYICLIDDFYSISGYLNVL